MPLFDDHEYPLDELRRLLRLWRALWAGARLLVTGERASRVAHLVADLALLRRDAQLHADVVHPALLTIHEVIATSDGVAVVYDWFDGELLNAPAERRNDPAEATHEVLQA